VTHVLTHNRFDKGGLRESISGVLAISDNDYFLVDDDWVIENVRYASFRHSDRKKLTSIILSISPTDPASLTDAHIPTDTKERDKGNPVGVFSIQKTTETYEDAAECTAYLSLSISANDFEYYKAVLTSPGAKFEIQADLDSQIGLKSDSTSGLDGGSIEYDWPPDGSGVKISTKSLRDGRLGMFAIPVKSAELFRTAFSTDEEVYFAEKVRKEEQKISREIALENRQPVPVDSLSHEDRLIYELSESRALMQRLSLTLRVIATLITVIGVVIVWGGRG
jgi:hypothetical protein